MRILLRLCLVTVLLLLSAALARAGAFGGVDLMTATVLQKHQSSFSGLAARVRLTSARIVDGFELMPYVEYWRTSNTVDPPDITVSRKDATLGAALRYRFHRAGWQPYVGGGLGVHFLSNQVNAPQLGLDDRRDSVIRGGLSALAGVAVPLSDHVENFIELEYHHLPDLSQLKINMGIGWGP
jgi:opacity protein-like surface antigen